MISSGIIIAILLGIGSSSALHISQALMRLGIVRLSLQEWVFGMAAGGFLALDALWKSLAQTRATGQMGLLPDTNIGWWLLLTSFLGAAGAFAMMLWSYWRHCRASGVVVGYNIMYVVLPLLLLKAPHLVQPGHELNVWLLAGLAIMLVGVI